jgi:hypothetical protein
MKKCKRCGKLIKGKISIHTYRKRVGKKSVVQVDYYDEECFYYLNLKKAEDEEKRANKGKA